MPATVRIRNFKSIEKLELELAPVTVLIGPPASGKSNILDALALLGYIGRHKIKDKEYNNTPIESPNILARYNSETELFRYGILTEPIEIELENGTKAKLNISYKGGKPVLTLNNTSINKDIIMSTQAFTTVYQVIDEIKVKNAIGKVFDIRVYGYERYALSSYSCNSVLECGFYQKIKANNKGICDYPINILSETGCNSNKIIKKSKKLLEI